MERPRKPQKPQRAPIDAPARDAAPRAENAGARVADPGANRADPTAHRPPSGYNAARSEGRGRAGEVERAPQTSADASARERPRGELAEPPRSGNEGQDNRPRDDWRKPDKRRGSARRGGRRRRRGRKREGDPNAPGAPTSSDAAGADAREPGNAPDSPISPSSSGGEIASAVAASSSSDSPRASSDVAHGAPAPTERRPDRAAHPRHDPRPNERPSPGGHPGETHEPRMPLEGEGMLVKEMGGFGVLRQLDNQYLPSRNDIFVPQRLIMLHRLRDGSIVRGRIGRGQKHKYALNDVSTVDGKPPGELKDLAEFKTLTTIDPDFHYAVGDATGDVSMRILDIICPVGRGQRGLIVAPPRAGKTTILRQFAKGIEVGYPDVRLMVLLVDERPEEATEWKRCTKGQVFVSTADEAAKTHVHLAELVWKRAQRLVELGEDVVVLLDSITRLARAYNNLSGGSGRTMSGGLDSQAMQRPRAIFGSARNTETAGSLTILGTTLIETGSRMDQMIFEEFKGTGNMELVLSRKLADRRIFPAIDIEKSGTRKEEKLYSAKRMKHIAILRRVLLRMNFIEAMELLVTKLEDVETNDDFLKRFEVDPEA
jgi:transcription termination factor Rho